MSSIEAATISGFNEYLTSLKAKKTPIVFGLARFDSMHYVPADFKKLEEVKNLTDYKPGAMTNLYDSIARAIKDAENYQSHPASNGKYKNLMVIMTDGQENASQEYNQKKIFDLIKEKEKSDWTFTFLGANQDSWASAEAMGVATGNSINFTATTTGTRSAFAAASAMTANYAMNTSGDNTKMFNAKTVEQFNDDVELDAKT